jgi:hypothetical protein
VAELYRYTTNTPRGPCEVCDEWDGVEGTADDLPPVPNPDCLNLHKCNCTHEYIGDDDDDDGEDESCCCFDPYFDEFWRSPTCDCEDGVQAFESDCDRTGGDGGDDGVGLIPCMADTDCLAPLICCDFVFEFFCVDYDECV